MKNTTKNKNRDDRSQSTQNTIAQLKQDFCNQFDALACGRSHFEVFRDWIEIAALLIHQHGYQSGFVPKDKCFETMETHHLEQVAKHDPETLEIFNALSVITFAALNYQWGDFLGEIYSEMGMGGTKSRQAQSVFFTPYSVAQEMAEFALEGCEDIIERQRYITIADSACGSGAVLIAAYEILARKAYPIEMMTFFEAVDINPLCCLMTFVQLSYLTLPGVVYHGDLLSGEFDKRWETARFKKWRSMTGRNPFQKMKMFASEPTSPTLGDSTVQLGLSSRSWVRSSMSV